MKNLILSTLTLLTLVFTQVSHAAVGGTVGGAASTIVAPAGTSGAPGYTFSGDTDTGFYKPFGNIFGVTAGGNPVVLWTTSGMAMQSSMRLSLQSGSVTAPPFYFSSDLASGFYYIGTGHIGLSLDGVKQIDYATNGITFIPVVIVPAGSASTPGLSFSNATDTGLAYLGGAMRLVAGGTAVADVSSSSFYFNKDVTVGPEGATTRNITVSGVTKLSNGTNATPSLTFTSDPDTGLYHVGANDMALAAGGVKSADVTPGTFAPVNLLITGALTIPPSTNAYAATETINMTNQAHVVVEMSGNVQLQTTGRVAGARVDLTLFNTNASASVTVTYQSLWRNCGMTNSSVTNWTVAAGKCWSGSLTSFGSGSETNIIVIGGTQGN